MSRFKEWSKENVKTRTTRSRTREGKRLGKTSSLESIRKMRRRDLTKSIFVCYDVLSDSLYFD
ncbi:hypothetical protein T03_11946 [Trichinella britovi]|uniref:Uncharacterized protein n=1 Tax=Trichinella britovi TaxID=45882 RepID=A0A0V1C8J3_TRIBR|nr:hypothetical protein T03_11946 [Trichinella britovi]